MRRVVVACAFKRFESFERVKSERSPPSNSRHFLSPTCNATASQSEIVCTSLSATNCRVDEAIASERIVSSEREDARNGDEFWTVGDAFEKHFFVINDRAKGEKETKGLERRGKDDREGGRVRSRTLNTQSRKDTLTRTYTYTYIDTQAYRRY